MARIPRDELERLKREVSLERLVSARGVKLHRHGKDLLGLCPFHDDHEPSLVVSPRKNLWHCLGACQAGGSVIDWVMKAEGVSFRHAVELLRADLPTLAPGNGSGPPPKRSDVQKLPSPLGDSAEDAELLQQVIGYYHDTLKESPDALAYLASRGLDSEELISRFRLGFANRTLGYRLPAKNRKAGAEIRGRLQRLGILRESGHEHFNGSLVVPVFDLGGRVVEIYGRKIGQRLRPGTPLHLYLPGPHRGVWNLDALGSSEEVVLCESLLDAMTFWVEGFWSVTAAYGVNGFTQEHVEAFEASGIERVLIAYDRDEAGDRAASGLAEQLLARGIGCYRVHFPKGMDANEYATKVRPARPSLDLVLLKAEWMGEGPDPSTVALQGERRAARGGKRGEAKVRAEQEEATESLEAGAVVPPSSPRRPASPGTSPGPPSPLPLAAVSSPERPEPPLLASAPLVAQPPGLETPTEVREGEVVITLEDRRYRVRGLEKNTSLDVLRVNLLATRGDAFHVDSFDLYSAPKRASYLKQLALELGMEPALAKQDLGRVLLCLEQLQDELLRRKLEPAPRVAMEPNAQSEALALLEDPRLLDRILEDLGRCGLVGEETNKLTAYLATISRKLERPLAVMVQSSSAAGKSALMDAVLCFVPEEERVSYSAMTGQSLYYLGETDLRHKVLGIAEEEGAEKASYALKLLQSEGELKIASTGKDPQSGKLKTHEYHVEGPVALLMTTTAIDLDEELLNRCLVLTVDEGREQTRAIHALQRERETLAGQLRHREREHIRALHQNAQRLLEPLLVTNPYAGRLRFPDRGTRTRRDHEKYLALIRSIALLHQHQRERKVAKVGGREVAYIEVEARDVEQANRLAHEVLGRSLDELPPQTRRLLHRLDELVAKKGSEEGLVRSEVRFTRRWLRERTGLGDTQLKVHLARLVDLEYLTVHPQGQRYVYELLYDGQGQGGEPFLPGLIGPEILEYDDDRSAPETSRSGRNGDRSGSGRPLVGERSGGGRIEENAASPALSRLSGANGPSGSENASGVLRTIGLDGRRTESVVEQA